MPHKRFGFFETMKDNYMLPDDNILDVVFTILFLIIICFFIYFSDMYVCHENAKTLGYKCNYSFGVGCVFEKPNGEKILLHKLRFIEK